MRGNSHVRCGSGESISLPIDIKRAAYGLIEYFLELECEMRKEAEKNPIDPLTLENRIDRMWGKCTLYNAYQFFVQLSSQKMQHPSNELKKLLEKLKASGNVSDAEAKASPEYTQLSELVEKQSFLWEGKVEIDCLSLYFNAVKALPQNEIRKLVINADNSLRSMGSAEKMLSSVYGIAITQMEFFTDPTIATLTSGTPSQNIDLAGFSFPRRMGVRLHPNFSNKYHLFDKLCEWKAYSDPDFKNDLGEDFYHSSVIDKIGWCNYVFKGIFPQDVIYLKLDVKNKSSKFLINTFYFKFTKSYKTSLDGSYYVRNPITGEKEYKDGVLEEMAFIKDANGKKTLQKKRSYFKEDKLVYKSRGLVKESVKVPVFSTFYVKYSEKPKFTCLVTPPHKTKYAQVLLIYIKQLFDVSVGMSYLSKDDQKPIVKTNYMFDEFGNLRSDGHGISGFPTMCSIGLAQEQLITIVLQNISQLTELYGDSADKTILGNVANIIFLKSNDTTTLKAMEEASGIKHIVLSDSRVVSKNLRNLFVRNENIISDTISSKEVPVISFNDLAYLKKGNAVVYVAGENPIWNKKALNLPMSYAMFKNTIGSEDEYSLYTVPTMSTAKDFDVRSNQPNFKEMLDKRIKESTLADVAKKEYQELYGYNNFTISQLDPELYAEDVMDIVRYKLSLVDKSVTDLDETEREALQEQMFLNSMVEKQTSNTKENTELTKEIAEIKTNPNHEFYAYANKAKEIYLDNNLSAESILEGMINNELITVFKRLQNKFAADAQFTVKETGLYDAKGQTAYIVKDDSLKDKLKEMEKDHSEKMHGFDEDSIETPYIVKRAFLEFLVNAKHWNFAGNSFENELKRALDLN